MKEKKERKKESKEQRKEQRQTERKKERKKERKGIIGNIKDENYLNMSLFEYSLPTL